MNRKKELLYNTLIIGIGSIFSKVLSFILVPLYTIWLSPSEYGAFDLLYSYVALLVPILTLQLEQAVIRFVISDKENSIKYIKVLLIILTINSLLFLLIGKSTKFNYSNWFCICTVSYAYQIAFTEYLRGLDNLVKYSFANILCGILNLFFCVIFVYILKQGVNGMFMSLTFSYIVTAIYSLINSNIKITESLKKIDKKIFKTMIFYSLPLLPNAISWWITNVSDRTIIKIFLGNSSNGIYAISCKIPTLLSVFYSIFNLAWQQSAMLSSNDTNESKRKFYNEIYTNLNKMVYSGAYIIISFTPLIYKWFINKDYASGMFLVPILVLGTVSLNSAQFLGGILLGEKNTIANGITTVIAAAANIIINLTFVKYIGLYAAAISTYISYIILFFLRLINVKKYIKNINAIIKYIIYNIVGIIIAILSFGIKNNVEYILIYVIVFFVFFIFNKNVITSLLFKVFRRKG